MITIEKIEGKDQNNLLNNINLEEVHYKFNEIPGKLFKSKKYELVYISQKDVIKYIKEYIKVLEKSFNTVINSEVKYQNECYNVLLINDNQSLLIGKDGRTLNSIQLLLHQTISNLTGFNIRINVDVGNYKEKKLRRIEREIKKIAKEVLNSKIEAKLDPMNSYERRIVHTIISDYDKLQTESIGQEPMRYVVIKYKED
jgi:spoIIIJ-associated protein